MKLSMNGFRRNLSDEVNRLRNEINSFLNDEHVDKEDLASAMNEVICMINGLNCVYVEGDPDFTDIGHIEVELLEYNGEQAA
ncbi:hypothetical protein [Marinobacterium sp. BA1]|uniref:hypothetical protein n=1 Tax=Marinobacterium sp. BA1 TaxID=3138931 RepID=UPI0032E75A98